MSSGQVIGMRCVMRSFFARLPVSINRYMIPLAPIYLALGLLLARHRNAERAFVAVSVPISLYLLDHFVTGRWAG